MNKSRLIVFGSVVAAAMIFGAVAGATVFARGTLTNAAAAIVAAASPSPTFKSNENATHEKNESAAQEAAENNGTFRPGPGGPGGHPCGGPGHSNETSSHEAGESSAVEAGENAACPSPPAGTTSGG